MFEFLKGLGPLRLAALGAVTAGLIAFFAFVTMQVSKPPMSLLYSGLPLADSAEIVARLEGMNIPYELKGDGSTIMVPRDDALRLRMTMAEEGLPAGGTVGYEIFDEANALGTTSFVQNLNHLRALEGELARTIRSLDSVQAARVHLVLPERELFTRDRQEPSASIVVKARGGLSRGQAKGIQNLVAAAVEGLTPGQVSIIDETGTVLAGGDGAEGGLGTTYDERQRDFENHMRKQVADIVTSVVGPNRARIQVAADLDFNRITRNSETYDPDGQVVRSTQTVEESSSNVERDAEQGVTVGNALPEALGQGAAADDATARESAARVEETVNYEISRTTTTEVVEGGRINRLSVAVLVDGTYTTDEEGNRVYQARDDEELALIGRLVRSAIGFDEARGDRVEVVNLPINESLVEPLDDGPGVVEGMIANIDMMRMIELGAMFVVSLLVIFLVVRPIVSRIFATPQPVAAGGAVAALAGPDGAPQLALPPGMSPEDLPTDPQELEALGLDPQEVARLPNPTSGMQQMIDIAKVEGQVRESSVRKVGEIVQNHPEEALSILRNWLHETT